MGGAYSTHGRNVSKIVVPNVNGSDDFEDLAVDGTIIL